MRLIRLHVENFGCLSNYDLDFQEGLNSVLQENGWGKSTLAAFLRVMFYGLEGERKRGYSENDRLKYKPWNGGSFGGSLEFEAGGKRYLVTRDFGEKDKDAFFRLQDATTLLDSSDHSEKLGEELFGIDRESYEKTSFIDGADLRYRGINAVIGSKVGSGSPTDDFSNYDAAQERIKNYLNANSPKKKTGELYKLYEEIQELTRDTRNQGLVEERIEGIKNRQEQEREKQKALKERKESLQKELAGLARERNKLMNANRKKDLEAEVRRRREAVRELESGFGGTIPTREELRALNEKTRKAREQMLRLSGYDDGDQERQKRLASYFRNGVPGEIEIQAQIETCNEVQDLLQKAAHLEEQAKREEGKIEESAAERGRIEAMLGLERARKAKAKRSLHLLGGLLLFLGLLIGAMVPILHGNALLFLPAVILIATSGVLLISPYVRGMAKEDTPIGEADLILRQERQAKDLLESTERDLETTYVRIHDAEEEIGRFLTNYGFSYHRENSENLLYEIKNKAKEYSELCLESEAREKTRRELETETEKQRAEISADLARLRIPVSFEDYEGIKNWVENAMQSLTAYEKEQGEEAAAIKAENSFLREHPELEVMEGELPTEETLQRREREIEKSLTELSREEEATYESLSNFKRSLDEAYDNAENLRAEKERLEELKDRYGREEGKYRIVEKTQSFLKVAKEQYTSAFMQPMKMAFDRYYELMTGRENAGSEFQMDANLNISRKEEGRFHDIEAQSAGYADVIGLCIRLSLLDAMYEKESPLVIMDDPFTNLDEKHLFGAKKFLRKISEKYQILYLTCHETRSLS